MTRKLRSPLHDYTPYQIGRLRSLVEAVGEWERAATAENYYTLPWAWTIRGNETSGSTCIDQLEKRQRPTPEGAGLQLCSSLAVMLRPRSGA